MPAKFSDPSAYAYTAGTISLGLDDRGQKIGIDPETHLLTVAASGSGKGVGLIVPNTRQWAHNLLVIDPKGENARLSYEAREAMGQRVAVIDPYQYADIPARLRKSFNPLAAVEVSNPNAREDLEVIADGLIVRADPRHAQWDDGAAALLAGVTAFVCATAPAELRTLTTVRAFLLQPPESIRADTAEMAEISAFGGLCKAASLTLVTALDDKESMEADFLAQARRQTAWLDFDPIKDVLAASTFDLTDLKNGKLSLFLVLPPKYLTKRAGLLRLFVRSAIDAMMTHENGRRCLFILDEFAALGRIEEVAKNAPVMRSYGLHLWPFLQNLGQLSDLYGDKGAEGFMANADAHLFFGNDLDGPALRMVSARLGTITAEELVDGPPTRQPYEDVKRNYRGSEADARAKHIADEQNQAEAFRHALSAKGRPRLTPEEVARLTGKPQGENIARSMVAFLKGGDILNLYLAPYFTNGPATDKPLPPRVIPPQTFAVATPEPVEFDDGKWIYYTSGVVIFLLVLISWFILSTDAEAKVSSTAVLWLMFSPVFYMLWNGWRKIHNLTPLRVTLSRLIQF